jgi:hypothetical protein
LNISPPGPDQIQFRIWKKGQAANPQILPTLINPLLQFSYHHFSLKKAVGIVHPKPNKPDYSTTSFFRFISLLQTISKILEKLVADSLYSISDTLGLVHPNQCGILPSISTADTVVFLKNDVITTQKAGIKFPTLFLDIKEGFDNILPHILANMLVKC